MIIYDHPVTENTVYVAVRLGNGEKEGGKKTHEPKKDEKAAKLTRLLFTFTPSSEWVISQSLTARVFISQRLFNTPIKTF